MRQRKPLEYDAIILGAGAAGLMCASVAGQRGRRVALLDRAKSPGKKILISGGGRCNFTNFETPPERYLSQNPHFAKSALHRYPPSAFIDLVDQYRITWHEKTLGQLFCDGSAKQILAMLMAECRKGQVLLSLEQNITRIHQADGRFFVETNSQNICAPALILASGGLSIPKMGATGLAYDTARNFGLRIVDPRPALVPLTLDGKELLFRSLSGVSTKVVAHCGKANFKEAALLTHKGLSGPAILQISSYWQKGQPLYLNFLPDAAIDWLLSAKSDQPRAKLSSVLGHKLPARLAEALHTRMSDKFEISSDLANMPNKVLMTLQNHLACWRFSPNGTEGFAKAEVTIGGVSTDELSSKTLEAKRVPGLYVIGEAVDVTGWLGGYNFQWAWASAQACGQAL